MPSPVLKRSLRESSFNMTRVGGGMKILRGRGLRKFFDNRKGGSEKIRGRSENLYASKPTGEGGGGGGALFTGHPKRFILKKSKHP